MLRELDDMSIVVAVGKRAVEFNGMITLNRTGTFMWKQLTEDISESELLERVLNKYQVEQGAATADIKNFLKKLRDAGLIDE